MNEAQKQAKLYERQHAIYERRLYPIFLNALKKQVQPTIDWVASGLSSPPLDTLVDPKVFRLPIVRAYEMIGQLAAKREYFYIRDQEKVIIDFLIDKWRKIFYDYSVNYAYRISNELSETTREEIRKALLYATEHNLNADQTASYIRKEVQNKISRARSVTIARTETTTASNLGKDTGARTWLAEQNQKGYKQWLGRNDSRERHSHRATNNEIVPLDDKWTLTDDKGVSVQCGLPGETTLPANERINCRCTFLVMSERRYNRMQAQQQ